MLAVILVVVALLSIIAILAWRSSSKLRVAQMPDGSLLALYKAEHSTVYKILPQGIRLHLYEHRPGDSQADRLGFIRICTFEQIVAATILYFLVRQEMISGQVHGRLEIETIKHNSATDETTIIASNRVKGVPGRRLEVNIRASTNWKDMEITASRCAIEGNHSLAGSTVSENALDKVELTLRQRRNMLTAVLRACFASIGIYFQWLKWDISKR